MDASLEWLTSFRENYSLHLPILKNADEAFTSYRLGYLFRTLPPLFIVIDKRGIVRHRSLGRGSISIEEVAELMERLLQE